MLGLNLGMMSYLSTLVHMCNDKFKAQFYNVSTRQEPLPPHLSPAGVVGIWINKLTAAPSELHSTITVQLCSWVILAL